MTSRHYAARITPAVAITAAGADSATVRKCHAVASAFGTTSTRRRGFFSEAPASQTAWAINGSPPTRRPRATLGSTQSSHHHRTMTRSTCTALLLVACMASFPVVASATTGERPATCATSGPASPGDLHREWILVGWEKHRGDPPFDFRRRLGHLYHWNSNDVRLYDTFDPQHRVARSASEWASIWTEPFTALKEARHSVLEGPDVIDGGTLSASTLEFAARLETAAGEIIGNRARTSLVWECTSGGWKIVREHTSVRLVSREEIDAIVPHPGK